MLILIVFFGFITSSDVSCERYFESILLSCLNPCDEEPTCISVRDWQVFISFENTFASVYKLWRIIILTKIFESTSPQPYAHKNWAKNILALYRQLKMFIPAFKYAIDSITKIWPNVRVRPVGKWIEVFDCNFSLTQIRYWKFDFFGF